MKEMRKNAIVVTYCSREKDPSGGLLPAKDRYLSPRIRATGEAAKKLGIGFRILSGIYGLLEPGDRIPDYDHLLTADQAPDHAQKLAGQLEMSGIAHVVFVTRTPAVDPGAVPYRQAIRLACEETNLGCTILEIGLEKPSAAELAGRIDSVWGPGRYQ